MLEPVFNSEQLAELRAYHFPHYVWQGLSLPLTLLSHGLMLGVGVRPIYACAERLAARLRARASPIAQLPVLRVVPRVLERLWGDASWPAALLFTWMQFFIPYLVFLPVQFFLGYVWEHRFGLSRYTLPGYLVDEFKGLLIHVVALGCLAFGLFGLARRLERWWLLMGVVSAALLLGSAALDPYRAQIYFKQEPLRDGLLRTEIDGLMARAKIDFREVLVEQTALVTPRVQAYFAGSGPTRTIVLNDALVANMTVPEVLAAVAHEAGHVNEPKGPNGLASAAALLFFLFLVDRILRKAGQRGWFGARGRADIRALPLVLFAFVLLWQPVAPVSAWFSRQREFAADRYALELTQDADTFERMLTRAARVNKMDPDPPPLLVWLGRSHPPFVQRLEAAERWKSQRRPNESGSGSSAAP